MFTSSSLSFNNLPQKTDYETFRQQEEADSFKQQEEADSFYSHSELNENTAYTLTDQELNESIARMLMEQDLNEIKAFELKPTALKISHYIKEFLLTGGKEFLLAGGVVGTDLALTEKITNFATTKLGFCLGNWIPSTGLSYLNSLVVTPLARLNQQIGNLFGSNVSSEVIIPALCEEIEFRWFVQNILLKQVPKKVIEQISPDLVNLVDSLPAKVSRVTAAALFFAICHTYALDCPEGGGVYQLVGGLLYGTLYEFSDQNLMHCINLHALYNIADKYLIHP